MIKKSDYFPEYSPERIIALRKAIRLISPLAGAHTSAADIPRFHKFENHLPKLYIRELLTFQKAIPLRYAIPLLDRTKIAKVPHYFAPVVQSVNGQSEKYRKTSEWKVRDENRANFTFESAF